MSNSKNELYTRNISWWMLDGREFWALVKQFTCIASLIGRITWCIWTVCLINLHKLYSKLPLMSPKIQGRSKKLEKVESLSIRMKQFKRMLVKLFKEGCYFGVKVLIYYSFADTPESLGKSTTFSLVQKRLYKSLSDTPSRLKNVNCIKLEYEILRVRTWRRKDIRARFL